MNKSLLAIGTAATMTMAGLAWAQSQEAKNEEPTSFPSEEAKESYSMGSMIGQQLKKDAAGMDLDSFLAGLNEGFAGLSKLDVDEINAMLQGRQEREQAAVQAKLLEHAAQNEATGSSFRADFAKQGDVVTLDSGLQYKVLERGEGSIAGPGGVATLHYRGSFVDGTEFDSSYGSDPVQVEIGRVIPGWSEALERMPAGSKWQLVIPPDLAYGNQGAGSFIAPGSTLVFELELLEVS
jgi:FKBP-type peptidyl-prolyl cis-trans isomerase FklB